MLGWGEGRGRKPTPCNSKKGKEQKNTFYFKCIILFAGNFHALIMETINELRTIFKRWFYSQSFMKKFFSRN
jgi:hypothetical protein